MDDAVYKQQHGALGNGGGVQLLPSKSFHIHFSSLYIMLKREKRNRMHLVSSLGVGEETIRITEIREAK